MATPFAPRCEIRRVIVHFYPDGLKGGGHPCEQRFFGKCPATIWLTGSSRLSPDNRGCTVSVI
jgi:hypothetical protein